MERAGGANVFPPGPNGPPFLLLLGILGVTSGIVFLVSAVHPRPNQKRAAAEKSSREDAALGQAEAYYTERSHAADRDWRAAPITPPPAQPLPVQTAPVAQVPPPPPPVKPATIVPPPAPHVAAPPVQQAAPGAPPAAPPAASAPVAPPPTNPFPSPVTLNPIPRPPPPAPPVAPPPPAGPHQPIRAAIAAGKLTEAEQMLNAARESATGIDLAHLTALAGDHAAAAGQQSHAKWLWRLAMKRFGENGALESADAQRIAALLNAPR